MGYLSVLYSDKRKPTSSYPGLLCKYLVDHYFKDNYKKILDVGCGRGVQIREFQKLGYEIKGVDKLEEARELSPDLHIDVVDMEYEPIPYPDNSLDVVFSKSSLEHLSCPDNFMGEVYRVLKPGGRIIVSTPDWESVYKTFYLDYTHKTPYIRISLVYLLQVFGFKVVEVKRFIQLPFLWRMPWLSFIPMVLRYFPKSENKWIRFSREAAILGIGEK